MNAASTAKMRLIKMRGVILQFNNTMSAAQHNSRHRQIQKKDSGFHFPALPAHTGARRRDKAKDQRINKYLSREEAGHFPNCAGDRRRSRSRGELGRGVLEDRTPGAGCGDGGFQHPHRVASSGTPRAMKQGGKCVRVASRFPRSESVWRNSVFSRESPWI